MFLRNKKHIHFYTLYSDIKAVWLCFYTVHFTLFREFPSTTVAMTIETKQYRWNLYLMFMMWLTHTYSVNIIYNNPSNCMHSLFTGTCNYIFCIFNQSDYIYNKKPLFIIEPHWIFPDASTLLHEIRLHTKILNTLTDFQVPKSQFSAGWLCHRQYLALSCIGKQGFFCNLFFFSL